MDTTLVSLVPPYSNVRIRLVDAETAGSDTCTFHRTLLQQVLSGLWTAVRHKHWGPCMVLATACAYCLCKNVAPVVGADCCG